MTGEEMAVKLAETEARSKSNTHRLDHLEKSTEAINRLATSVEVMAKEQKHQTEAIKEVKTDLSDLSGKVEKIEAEPGNRWKTLVEKVILLVTAAVVGYILARVAMSGKYEAKTPSRLSRLVKRIGKIPHLFAKVTIAYCVAAASGASWYALRIMSRTGNDPAALLGVILGFFGGELLLLCLKTVLKKDDKEEPTTKDLGDTGI